MKKLSSLSRRTVLGSLAATGVTALLATPSGIAQSNPVITKPIPVDG